MNNQAKIAELKKNINNNFFPEALKPKLLAQIEKLEAEDKAFENKGILPHPKPKQSKTSVAKIDGMPKFVIGDIVVLKGETTLEKEIIDRRMNNKNQYVYKAKYVSKPSETGEWNESELELFNSNGKGILPHPKPKFKAGDTISFTVASNKPEVLVGKLEYRDSYGLFTVVDGREYELKKLLEVKLITKPKKPTVARTVKSELKKYYAHREIKTVTVIEDGKKVVYKGEDVLNGAQFLAKGGKVDEIATYYPIRAIVEVTLDNGEKVKPANGYHIKNGAKPIAELGAALATEEIINNSIETNPYHYAKGGKLKESTIDFYENDYKKLVGRSSEGYPFYSIKSGVNQKIFDDKTNEQVAVWNSENNELNLKKATPKLIEWLKNNSYISDSDLFEKEGQGFDYKQKYDKTKIKSVADVKQFFKYLHNTEKLIFHPDDDFEGNMEDHITKKQAMNLDRYMLDCFDVCEKENVDIYEIGTESANEYFAKGGWTKDHKYLNKSENYELRYAKGKNRKEYKADGGPIIGRKAKGISVNKIAEMHDVSENYLRKQLERGQKVELEHTTDESIAYAIAKDHLYENPDYYILLEQIEMKADGGKTDAKLNFKDFSETLRLTGDHNNYEVFYVPNNHPYFKKKFSKNKQTAYKEYLEMNLVSKNKSSSKPKKQGSKIFDIAKEIRKPGESWRDAVSRASLQLK